MPGSYRRVILFLFLACCLAAYSGDHGSNSAFAGFDHSLQDRASTLLERINALNDQFKHAEAIPLARELLVIVEKGEGRRSAGVVACLNILGGLHNSLGDYLQAENHVRRAIQVAEGLGGNPQGMINSLGLLAQIKMNQGDYRAAEPVAARALALREAEAGKNGFMVSTSLNTLGEIYLNLQEYSKAESFFLRAVEIRRDHANPHALLITMKNLAQLYYNIRDLPAAESLATAALEIGRNALVETHPHLADNLNLLGKIEACKGRYAEAYAHFRKAQQLHLAAIDHMKGFTSEDQKLRFLSKIDEDYQAFLTLVLERFPHDPQIAAEALSLVFKRKGIVLEIQRHFQEAVFSGQAGGLDVFRELSDVRAALAQLTFSIQPGENSAKSREKFDKLLQRKEQLEINLSSVSKSYDIGADVSNADCGNIASVLPNGAALVEIVRVKLYDFGKGSVGRWKGFGYVAFVLGAEGCRGLSIVNLGDARPIDDHIASFRNKVNRLDADSLKQLLYESGYLYKSVFQPLESKLRGSGKIFISPDGDLNLIPFEVLSRPDGRFLVEDYAFNYLTCGRDLRRFYRYPEKGRKSVIFANPDYNLNVAQPGTRLGGGSSTSVQEHGHRIAGVERGMNFEPLPEATREALRIRELLGGAAELYLEGKALKEVLVRTERPRYLHLATHAFFLGEPNDPSSEFHRGLVVNEQPASLSVVPLSRNNPLLLAGFALAGANGIGRSKGIMTAEEVLGLRLRGTEMVVLSACTTGLGEVRAGNGVWGLRMAFTQAGARSLVMSMWRVPDRETKELMVRFYENISSGRLNRAEALREAIIEQMRSAGPGNSHPFYWGGFIFLGEP